MKNSVHERMQKKNFSLYFYLNKLWRYQTQKLKSINAILMNFYSTEQKLNSNKRMFHVFKRATILVLLVFATSFSLQSQTTLYSFQTGNWSDASTWTTHASGNISEGAKVPENGDIVIILSSRTVTLTADITTDNLDITINDGGYLNQSTFIFTKTLNAFRGSGTLQLATTNFPIATTNTFVNAGGGTTEYSNTADFVFPTQNTYNNLTINAPGVIATQTRNLTLNGNLYVKKGTFRINDNTSTTKLELTIEGNVLVDNGAAIRVGQGSTNTTTSPLSINIVSAAPYTEYYEQFHRVVVNGNFTNSGTVRFTNLDYPIFDAFPPLGSGVTSGAASVYFRGATDNTLTCNSTTDFYNLIVDKGSDQTFKLTVYSTAYPNFRLFGANTAGGLGGTSDPNLKKALWIKTGTLILKGLTIIPSLSEGTCATETPAASPNSDFYIPVKAALILDGPEVIVLSTADDYGEINAAYNVNGGTGLVNGVTKWGCSSYSIYGKLQINDGYFSTRESGGFITWDVSSGQFIINGGVVDAKQFRAAGNASGLASFTQTGGLFILRGKFERTTAYSSISDLTNYTTSSVNTGSRTTSSLGTSVGSFNINSTANVFSMSGGTIRIYDVCGDSGTDPNYAFQVKSSVSNINVTGGTVELIPMDGNGNERDFYVSTTAAINNLTISRASGTRAIILDTPLTILNNLNITAGVLNANNNNLTVGGNFNLASGTTYTPGTNTTTFNLGNLSTFTLNGTVASERFQDLVINKESGSLTLAGTAASNYTILNTLQILSGTFNVGSKTLSVAGNVTNSGTQTGTGAISLNGTSVQDITGDGTGIFQNLTLNNTNAAAAPVSLSSDISVNGILNLQSNKIFNIGRYKLSLGSTATISGTPGASRFIATDGNVGDKGISKTFSSNSFSFPIGVIPTAIRYTPTTITFSTTPSAYGTVSVTPVDAEQMQTSSNGKQRSLTYFWRIRSSGFNLGSASVSQTFIYDQSDYFSNNGNITEAGYVPARYNPSTFTWNKGTAAQLDESTNTINWPNNVNYIDGDYTAGDDNPQDPFGAVLVLYSYQSGNWRANTTWMTDTLNAASVVSTDPDENTPVMIRNGHTVTCDNNGNKSGSLQIQAGGILDCNTQTGLNFGIVSNHTNGSGKIRISGATFPGGDFSDFIGINGGTVEYYGGSYTIPTNSSTSEPLYTYKHLIVNPTSGQNITLPDRSLTIFGNLTTQNGNTYLNTGGNSRTITINGNLNVISGNLYINNASSQNVIIDGNLTVNGNFSVINTNGTHNLTLYGNLINNGTLNFQSTASRVCNITFMGNANSFISGSGATTLNKLTVNKGNSQSTTLTLDIGGSLTTPQDNWLTLQNGTLRYIRVNPSSDFTISTVTPFTIPSTAGLYVDYSNSGSRNILIANGNSNDNDLFLYGKLTLVQGNVYVGSTTYPNYNNDIEYSGSGSSTIEIQGGNLFVNGQVRRNPATTDGILSYVQSGGSVVINGQNANTTNAKFEVLNTGTFNMSGSSTLTIVRGGGGTTYGDLYLRPQSSSVTGGTIILSQGSNDQEQTYRLDASVPLHNLTITGKNTATVRNATVNLMVNPLVLNGNLTLSNTQSILNSNNINVTLKGDFTNNGTYNYGTNLTSFNGNIQEIAGSSVTNFYNLTVNPVTSLSLIRDVTVNNNLSLSGGTLICGANTLNLKGNFTNNATYTNSGSGGVIMNGSVLQYLAGTGTFGRLELNNSSGAKLQNSLSLQDNLIMTAGNFDVNLYLLTLGQNSSIIPNGTPFSVTKMVTSQGAFSDVGIRKFFKAEPATFIYPIGIAGEYTPGNLTISANASVGSIRVNAINERHPAVTDASNVLQHYWEVESFGISGFAGNMVFTYSETDVEGPNEDEYVAARLIVPGTEWSKAATGSGTDNVDETNNKITFTFPSGTENLSGEYTAGTDAAIPNSVMTYTSNGDGLWTDQNIWTPVAPAGGPNGFIVVIRAGDEITMNADHLFAYRTAINGKLKAVSPYFGHNLGTVSGNGVLYMENGNLPAGRFTAFLDCVAGGTLEYGGTGNYTLIADRLDNIPKLWFTGSGTRVLPNKNLTICQQLLIDGPTLDNSINNRKLIIQGTFERVSGAFSSGTGPNATVAFAGSSVQSVTNFTGANSFNNLEMDNTAGLSLAGSIDVSGNLLLTNGIISASSVNSLTLTNSAVDCVYPSGGSSSSYVNGPLIKKINAGDSFIYPIGKGTNLGNKLTLSSTQSGTLLWTAEYFRPNTTAGSVTSPLTATNSDEYWKVTASVPGSAAKVKIAWDSHSGLTPIMTQNGVADMRVSEYNTGTSSWTEIASSNWESGSAGYSITTDRVTLASGTRDFTLASIGTMKPRARLNPSGPVCGTAGIPISITTSFPINFPYTLSYNVNGVAQTAVTINSLPYILPTQASGGTYQLTGFAYNGGTGVVDDGIITVYAVPTTANAGTDLTGLSTCGATSVTLAGNDPAPYTGLWTIISGTGGSVVSPTSYNSQFNGTNGSTYTLRWTISNETCTSADDVVVKFNLLPSQPALFTNSASSVCQGQTGVVYTVPNDPGITYAWTYSGADVTFSSTTNSVTIDFGSSATSGTLGVTASNSCGTSLPRTIAVTVNTSTTITSQSTATQTRCIGVAFDPISVVATGAGTLTYQWYSNTSASNSGGTLIPGAINPSYTPAATATGTTYYYCVVHGDCGADVTSVISGAFIVNPENTVTAASATPTLCISTALTSITHTTTGATGIGAATGLPAGVSAAWAGNTITINGTPTESGTFNYSIPLSGGCGTVSATGSITVNALPEVSISISENSGDVNNDGTICNGDPIILTASGGVSYLWDPSTSLSNSGVSNPTATPSADITYTVTATDGNGCKNTATQAVTVIPKPSTGDVYRIPNN